MGASPSHTAIVLLWLLCILIMFSSFTCSSKVHCNKQDMNTLLNFKQGVIDPSGVLSSWLTEKDCCQWTGIQCNNITGRVTQLNLPCHTIPSAYSDEHDKSHCLTGELRLSLLNLEFLSYLNLTNNDFKAIRYNSMPIQTCNHLSRGTLPYQCGNYSNLHYLDFSYNYDLLIDNLHWISPLSSLEYLHLGGTDLHKETDWLRSVTLLPSLSELYLESCQLQDIYPSLQYANFTSLRVLVLALNDFNSELPGWIFNLSDISTIYLTQSHTRGQLPKTLPNIGSIENLFLAENNLDGPIPDWLGQLEQLQELDLSENSFSGPIPTNLGNISSLTALSLVSNQLTGNISERNFHSLLNLNYLIFGSPALVFDFDPEWVPPFKAQVIWLEYGGPKFPSWLYTQSSLKSLTMAHSRASFEPLDKFWKFAAQFEFFSLTNTSINADMSNVMLNSRIVWLIGNKLRGGVPRVSPNVTLLNLNDNYLSGSISPLLCHKMKEESKLEFLSISSNLLSGEIPNCWMDWKSLLYIGLGDNNLTGKIPHSMGSLSNLISLNLNNNSLSGKVPLSLKNCKNLWILNLEENKFSGAIPSWMGQNVKALQLRSNQFSGIIPAKICQLHSLKILDFANNRLWGPVPNCLHNMTSMISEDASFDKFVIRILTMNQTRGFIFGLMMLIKGLKLNYYNSLYAIDLSSNSLSGIAPMEIFMLTRLQSLNLSHNQFVGTIPQEIGNLKELESLDLSSNRLSGRIPQSMSGLSFLEVLNLSFNNFVGEIPSGTQLQGFSNLSYMGNPELCGPPLTKNCPKNEKPDNSKQMGGDDESEVNSWFYMGIGIGFATGFWGVLGVIFFNKRCRHAYFRFLGKLYDMVTLKMNSIYWSLRNCYTGN